MADQQKIRLQLVLWSLNGGGAERIACYLLNHMNREKFELKMTLIRKAGPYLKFVNESDLSYIKAGNQIFDFDDQGNRAIFKPFQLLRAAFLAPYLLNREIKKYNPDIVLSFCKGMSIVTMAATWFSPFRKYKWIVREGNNTDAVIDDELKNPHLNKALKFLTYFCFKSADGLLAISKELANQLSKVSLLQKQKINFIHNAVNVSEVQKIAEEKIESIPENSFFLAVGRIDRQKAFDTLIRAFARTKAKKNYKLVILGQGPDLESLKELAYTEGVLDRVLFPGFQNNPWAWMKRADAFVLSSRWEGFGNVTIEAMACGTPVIVSNCSFGPREIIDEGKHGILVNVDDVQGFSIAMDKIAEDPALKQDLKQRSLLRAKDFDISKIVAQYEQYFSEIYAERH